MILFLNLIFIFFFFRIGPVEVDPIEMQQLNNQLVADLEKSDDSASDEEEDAFNWEWEAVSKIFDLFIISFFIKSNIFFYKIRKFKKF